MEMSSDARCETAIRGERAASGCKGDPIAMIQPEGMKKLIYVIQARGRVAAVADVAGVCVCVEDIMTNGQRRHGRRWEEMKRTNVSEVDLHVR